MKKNFLIFKIGILYLLIVSSIFSFIALNNKNTVYDEIVLIDVSTDNSNLFNGDEIINKYVNKYNNNDVVGEISFVNTDYKKAIMQSNDNDYYLNHLEDKTNSYMGSIYLDFRIDINNDKKLLIFGHNSNKIAMPFKILENYYSQEYYNAHQYIRVITENRVREYIIYSVFVEVNDFSYMKTEFSDGDEWFEHINNFKKKSMYETGVDVNENDNIIVLQTCSTHHKYSMYEKKYLLIVGKEIVSKF